MVPTTVKRMPSMRIVSPTAGRPAKSFLRSSRAEEGDAPALDVVLRAEPAAVARDLVADLAVDRLDAAHRGVGHAVAVGDLAASCTVSRLMAFTSVASASIASRSAFSNRTRRPGPLPARLLARLARPRHDRALAEGVERVDQDRAEAASRRPAGRVTATMPQTMPSIVSRLRVRLRVQVRPALDDELAEHGSASRLPAQRLDRVDRGGPPRRVDRGEERDRARAARRPAGPSCQVGRSPAKNCGMGSRFTRAHRP